LRAASFAENQKKSRDIEEKVAWLQQSMAAIDDASRCKELQSEELQALQSIFGADDEFRALGVTARGLTQFSVRVSSSPIGSILRSAHVLIRFPKLYPVDPTKHPIADRLVDVANLSEAQQTKLLSEARHLLGLKAREMPGEPIVCLALQELNH